MNFFANQDRARSETKKLVFMYAFTVALTAIGTGVCLILITQYNKIKYGEYHRIDLWTNPWLYKVTGIVSTVILIASFIKILLLGKGGKYVARLAGATEVDLSTSDPDLRRYINVVEEMSIASGTPMPAIYIMEAEESINAFAAGYEIDDAVIAVSWGALKTLTRDELQGVVAHEFSHIFNGDMKLNIKLIGYLFGLSMIAELGSSILRGSRHRSRSRRSSGGGDQTALFALVLVIIGYLGMFFASLIKAAISRQREFLADASAVQFTRNPDGIGGALKKIHANYEGSLINASRASEVSHMFFSKAVSNFFSLFSTHPPIPDRLKAVYGRFNMRQFEEEEMDKLAEQIYEKIHSDQKEEEKPKKETNGKDFLAGVAAMSVAASTVQQSIENSPGQITNDHIQFAQQLLGNLDTEVRNSTKTAAGARSLIFALLLDNSEEIKKRQNKFIQEAYSESSVSKAFELNMRLQGSDEIYRLPIVELSLSSLKKLTVEEIEKFLKVCKKLILADKKISISEFIIYTFLYEALNSKHKFFDKKFSRRQLREDVVKVFSFLAHIGTMDAKEAAESFEKGYYYLYEVPHKHLPIKEIKLADIGKSLKRLRFTQAGFKKEILVAANKIVSHDNFINVREFEIIRIISEAMLVPMPPIIPSNELA